MNDIAQTLINNGFRVWQNQKNSKYLFVSINNCIGYIQESFGGGYIQESFGGGYDYLTVHKPEYSIGTGFKFYEGNFNINIMKECCLCITPNWAVEYHYWVKKHTIETFIKTYQHLTEILVNNDSRQYYPID